MLRSCDKGRGVSIVEVLIALAILSVSAAAVYQQMAQSGLQGRHYERSVRRDLLAAGRLNELLALPAARLADWTPPTHPQPFAGEPLAPDEPAMLWQATVARGDDGLLRVRLTAGWAASADPTHFAQATTATLAGVVAP